jgi:succinate dehydrogenase / fumarate reductase flavoprotein subunit
VAEFVKHGQTRWIIYFCVLPNRTESRGGHAREDYPDRDDENWMKHAVTSIDESGKTTFEFRPVHLYTLTNEIQPFPPKARVY